MYESRDWFIRRIPLTFVRMRDFTALADESAARPPLRGTRGAGDTSFAALVKYVLRSGWGRRMYVLFVNLTRFMI